MTWSVELNMRVLLSIMLLEEGRLDIVQYLISERGCDPMCRSQSGTTSLHKASRYGHLDIVRFLIEEKNCDMECRDKDKNTPLHCAAMGGGALNIVQYLISEKRL